MGALEDRSPVDSNTRKGFLMALPATENYPTVALGGATPNLHLIYLVLGQ